MNKECVFCRIATSSLGELPNYDQPILETKNFFVVTALGQFIEGYVLICTKRHYLNMGTLDVDMIDEFQSLKAKVRHMLRDVYGKEPFFFEHGAANIGNNEATCVDHAHLHAIPIEVNDLKIFSSPYLLDGKVSTINSLIDFSRTGNPYFWIESSNRTAFLYDALLLPCQYGRRVAARLVNKSGYWNWRKYPFKLNMIKTSRQLKTWVSKHGC